MGESQKDSTNINISFLCPEIYTIAQHWHTYSLWMVKTKNVPRYGIDKYLIGI
jgi:hypothetical protein